MHITTYSNAEGLAARSLPSVLAQTHENLEVIVVGDAATPDVEAAVRSFDDPHVRLVNLTVRGPYPDDPLGLWLVAGTAPANEGLRLARGDWIAMNCDDDIFTPDTSRFCSPRRAGSVSSWSTGRSADATRTDGSS